MSSNQYHLSWNDFESNLSVAFREIREEKDFFDCTLSCGSEQIQAHKIILSACSPVLRTILKQNPHQHPLLYLKGVSFKDIQALLNFMYHGEVNVSVEELNSFLSVAKELKVKGLTVKDTDGEKQKEKKKEVSHISPTQVPILNGSGEEQPKSPAKNLNQPSTFDGLVPLVKIELETEAAEPSFPDNSSAMGFHYGGYEGFEGHLERGGNPYGIGSNTKKPKVLHGTPKPKTKDTLAKDNTETYEGITGGPFIENKAKRSRKVKAYLESLVYTGTALNTECGYGIILVASAVIPKCGPRGRGLNVLLPDKDGNEPEFDPSKAQSVGNKKEISNAGVWPDFQGLQFNQHEIKSEFLLEANTETVYVVEPKGDYPTPML